MSVRSIVASRAVRLWMAILFSLFSTVAVADPQGKSGIEVENPWVRITIPGRPAAGYMVVNNRGAQADAIVSASSPRAERVELHTHLMENGVMKMRPVKKVEVPAEGSTEFKSGGLHLMIFGTKDPLKDGDTLPMTVVFEKAGPVELEFRVETIAGSNKKKSGDSGHGAHKH